MGGPAAIDKAWLEGAEVVGVTAGASAPDRSVRAVIDAVSPSGGVELLSITEEGEYFPPPPQLRALIATLQAVIESGVTARSPGRPGPLDEDRGWDASQALALLGA